MQAAGEGGPEPKVGGSMAPALQARPNARTQSSQANLARSSRVSARRAGPQLFIATALLVGCSQTASVRAQGMP